uniref:BTB domain-containing protein n=1 Tax=Leersia perrieri TaxID=77586 RepID=A0A0D9XJW1_9ORYZ
MATKNNVKVKAQYQFQISFTGSELVKPPSLASREIHTFDHEGPCRTWGRTKFMKRKDFEKSNDLTDSSSFTIRCDVAVIGELRLRTEEITETSFVTVPPSDLNQQLGNLLETEKGADVVFEVAGETFAAHRCVLAARSPVFNAELYSSTKEGNASGVVSIEDMDPHVFKLFLRFVYTNTLLEMKEEEDVMCQHLLVAADRYNLPRLKLICEDRLCKYIGVGTVGEILVLADQHHCDRLKKACLHFLSSPQNLSAVVAEDGFEHLSRTANTSMSPTAAPCLGNPSRFPSASAIVADTETGYHLLRIDGYSRIKGTTPTGSFLLSSQFTVGSRRWRIKFYPNGVSADTADYISLYLRLDEKAAKVQARFLFQITLTDGKQVKKQKLPSLSSTEVNTYGHEGSWSWGRKNFIKREDFEKSNDLTDDSFNIRCDVAVISEIRSEITNTIFVTVPPSDITQKLINILETEKGTDMVFEVGDETFAAHRCVVAARSPVFSAELFGLMKEGNTAGVVRIEDMEMQVFNLLLRFMYTDMLPDLKEEEDVMCQHLLVAADRYNLQRLKLICEDRLCSHIGVGKVGNILALADQHHCDGLKKACLHFLNSPKNLSAVVAADGFEHLSRSCPSLMKELVAVLALPPNHNPPRFASASAIVADTVTGYHLLRIDGYSRIKGTTPTGSFLFSSQFIVGSHSWRIKYYPNGESANSACYISLYLRLDEKGTKNVNVQAQFQFQISNSDDKLKKPHLLASADVNNFKEGSLSWGYEKFLKWEDFEKSNALRDDSFTIRCNIAIVGEIRTEKTTEINAAIFVTMPPSDLNQQLRDLFESEKGADVVFEVNSKTFAAHRPVCSCSTVTGFQRGVEGDTGGVVRIEDMEPQVFRLLLHFVYTDTLPDMEEEDVTCQHLLVAADRYNLERLKLICEEKLCRYISVGTVTNILALADQHHCNGLKKACFNFLGSPANLSAVIAGDGFKHLSRSCPSLMEELQSWPTGHHLLKIDCYSLTKATPTGSFLTSNQFTVGAHRWRIRFYPNGDYADYISLFLSLDEKTNVKVQAQFNFLISSTDQLLASSEVFTFCEDSWSWGHPNFIKREDFEESSDLKDDSFTIRCDIVVIGNMRSEAGTCITVPPSDLNQQLGQLLESEKGAGVVFQVAGETFAAHRCVLAARSPVFSAELYSLMKEGNTAVVVRIEDMDAEVFKLLLRFVYTDSLPEMEEEDVLCQYLLVAADQYNLERLKLVCEDMLCKYVGVSTVSGILALADQHHCHGLKNECFYFLSSPANLSAVVAADGFDHLSISCPSLMKELVAVLALPPSHLSSNLQAAMASSSSTIVADGVAGYHILNINGYSLTKGTPTGVYISSGQFTVGGHRWRIKYYPNGDRADSADYISLFLMLDEQTNANLRVKAKYLINFADNVKQQPSLTSNEVRSFSAEGLWSWGFTKYTRREDFEKSNYLRHDSFSMRCDIVVITKIRTEKTTKIKSKTCVTVPPSNLNRQLGNLLETQKGVDVVFEVSGQTFAAHRCVLAARSLELYGLMEEGDTAQVVRIQDMEPQVFKLLLHFIYTDSLPEIKKKQDVMCQQLLVAANRYNLERLKLMCEEKLCEYISESTVSDMILLAEQHHCSGLKKACLDFLGLPANPRVVSGSRPSFVKNLRESSLLASMSSSTSAIITDRVAGNHILKINGYSLTKGTPTGMALISNQFIVGGYRWCIKYYPNGTQANYADYISLFLLLDEKANTNLKVQAKFQISFVDKVKKKPSAIIPKPNTVWNFSSKDVSSWGYPQFIKREDFEKSNHLSDDSFTLQCDIVIVGDIRVEETTLGKLLETQKDVDVVFEVNGQTFVAHWCVLAARSPVFNAELYGFMKEGDNTGVVRIEDMEAEVFKLLLHFVYTDSLPVIKKEEDIMCQHLLIAADRYNLERLKLICEKQLCKYISKDTVPNMLALADQHNCKGLKKACFSFIGSSVNMSCLFPPSMSPAACHDNPSHSASASAIVADTASGYHLLKIHGYSLTKATPTGSALSSSRFTIGGHHWFIEYYPNGESADSADYISIYLLLGEKINMDLKVQAKFQISFADQVKKQPSLKFNTVRTFDRVGFWSWGYNKFIKREDFQKSNNLKDDSFTIRCDIAVVREIRAEGTTKILPVPAVTFVSVPPSDIIQQLGDLLETEKGADVVFEVGGHMFAAHRCVLAARSPVFSAELYGLMKEGDTAGVVRIEDIEAQVFKVLLRFVYTDSLPQMKEEDVICQHLLVAADRYNLERLKLICEDKLCKYIGISSVANILTLADQHHCLGLKKACFNFLSSPANLSAVAASDSFKHLSRSCPSLMEELTGYHLLKINGYSLTKVTTPTGSFFTSNQFTVGCPKSHGTWNMGGFLAKFKFKFSYTGKVDRPSSLASDTLYTFCDGSLNWAHGKDIKREDLEKSIVLRDDSFTIRCDIVVIREIRTEILHHFQDLLVTEKGADVVFEVGGETFATHRCVLAARSPVFSAELYGLMMEGDTDRVVRIEDMEAQVFKVLLRFMYTDSLPEMEDEDVMCQHLLVAADRYNLQRLKLICEDRLCRYIGVGTVGNILALADQHHSDGLKMACFDFLSSPTNLSAAVAGDGFKQLSRSCPSLMEEVVKTQPSLTSVRTFGAGSWSMGFTKFIRIDDFEKSYALGIDSSIIHCDIIVREIHAEAFVSGAHPT